MPRKAKHPRTGQVVASDRRTHDDVDAVALGQDPEVARGANVSGASENAARASAKTLRSAPVCYSRVEASDQVRQAVREQVAELLAQILRDRPG